MKISEIPDWVTFPEEDWIEISPEEADEIAQDMRLPPYHLKSVDEETPDGEMPTGEYEICQRCGGEGCIECEEGLKDITGLHKIPDFSKFDDPEKS